MEKYKRVILVCMCIVLVVGFLALRSLALGKQDSADTVPPVELTPSAPPSPSPEPSTPPPSVEPEPEESPEPEPEPLPDDAAELLDVDLAALRETNSDVVAWILIPGTPLSYPVVQGEDNQFYLNNNWKKEPSVAGSVFLEATNNRDLSGFHLIVYAHRMNPWDDTMFGSLKHYDDLEYWREHPSVYLVADDGIRRYDIFSAYEASIRGLIYRLDLVTNHLEQDFVDSGVDNSAIDTGVVPDPDTQFLTLSTCTASGSTEYRWVVQAYLAQVYETAETPLEMEPEP